MVKNVQTTFKLHCCNFNIISYANKIRKNKNQIATIYYGINR